MIFVSIVWNLLLCILSFSLLMSLYTGLKTQYNKLKLKKPVALPLRAFSTGTILYCWEDWRRDNKAEFPVRYFLTETLPDFLNGHVVHRVKRLTYWIRCHTYNRYHVLNITGAGYKWGWIDADGQILHAAFKILTLYVEEELEGVFLESVPPCSNADSQKHWEQQIEREQEVKALYTWWTVDRPKKLEDEKVDIYDNQYKEDQHMLHRLIEVRSSMWT